MKFSKRFKGLFSKKGKHLGHSETVNALGYTNAGQLDANSLDDGLKTDATQHVSGVFVSSDQLEELQTELRLVRDNAESLEAHKKIMAAQLEFKENELSAICLEAEGLKKEIDGFTNKLSKSQEDKSIVDEKLKDANLKLDAVCKQVAILEEKKRKVTAEHSKLNEDLAKATKRVDALVDFNLKLQKQVVMAKKRDHQLKKRLEVKKGELEKERSNLIEERNKFDELIKQNKESAEQRDKFVQGLESQAREKFEAKQYAESLQLWNIAVNVEEAGAKDVFRIGLFWNQIALCHEKLKQFKDALNAVDQAIKRKPTEAVCFYNRACYNKILNNRQDAIDDLKKALELNPDYGSAKDLLVKLGKK